MNRDIDKHPIVHLKCLDNTCREFYVVCGPEAYNKVYDTYILETDTDVEYYQCVFNITLICKEDSKINAGELIVDDNSDINKLDTLLLKIFKIYNNYIINSLKYIYLENYDTIYFDSLTDRLNHRMLLGFETVLPTSISFKVGDTFKKVEIDSLFETCYKINILLSEDIRFRNNNAILFLTKLFYKNNIPTDIEFDKLVTAMINFLLPEFGLYPSKFLDIHDDTDDTLSNNEYSHGSIKTFLYAYDAHLIYAGFLSQYSIDLLSPNNKLIHWWKFLSLLAGLNKQKFNDVMQVRQIDKPTPKERELQRLMMPPVYSKYNSYEINGFSENNF